jgi:hypothetical protein
LASKCGKNSKSSKKYGQSGKITTGLRFWPWFLNNYFHTGLLVVLPFFGLTVQITTDTVILFTIIHNN